MNEATRLRVLALLGIEQWVPRAASSTADDAAPTAANDAESKIDALLPPAMSRASASSSPQREESAAAISPPAAPAGGERLACVLLPAGDGLLLIADLGAPDAPGLGGGEAAVLLRLAAALAPGSVIGEPGDFHWPPRGSRLPGMDKPGAAREALVAQLREQYKRGVRDVLLLGDTVAALLGDLPGLRLVRAPSLAAMAADPALKKVCWAAAAPLKRPS